MTPGALTLGPCPAGEPTNMMTSLLILVLGHLQEMKTPDLLQLKHVYLVFSDPKNKKSWRPNVAQIQLL